jgi:3-ketosteroid 9alpha-monooxygenase subunit A
MATAAEYSLGQHTFPRGWFMVADASRVTQKPHSVRFFGRDMVLYRGESGTAYMVGAYCPHMGTHIGKSETSFMSMKNEQVEGESIRCPYHAWRYGPDGKCNNIPYSDAIPPKAELGSYAIVERYGALWHWHDPEGGEPDFDLPDLPEWDELGYVHNTYDELGAMNLHQVEVVDNICDAQHLHPIHASQNIYFENRIRGARVCQLLGSKHELLGVNADMSEFVTWYTGPGILLSRYHADNPNPSYMIITHTPIDDGSVYVWHAVLTKIADREPTEEDVAQAQVQQKMSRGAFAQDFEIWSNKRPCLKPMQMPADGNFLKVRTWYKQFYAPRSEVPAILERCEGTYQVPGIPGAEEYDARDSYAHAFPAETAEAAE